MPRTTNPARLIVSARTDNLEGLIHALIGIKRNVGLFSAVAATDVDAFFKLRIHEEDREFRLDIESLS